MDNEVPQLIIDHEREQYMDILEDYQRVVEHFLNIARCADGGFDECADYNEVLGIALRASWSLQLEIDTARSIRKREASGEWSKVSDA